LLALSYPVDSLVLAVKKSAPEAEIVSNAANRRESLNYLKLPAMRQERIWLAVHRFDDSVYYRRLGPEEFLLLSALRASATVSEAITHAFGNTKLNSEEKATVMRESFGHASELGWFCSQLSENNPESLAM
jgi:hypothetical protein